MSWALRVVRGGVVREVRNWLIKPRQWPYFSPWNVAVHGITPNDVADAQRWEAVWEEALPLLQHGTVVAHNASFDMGVESAPRSPATGSRIPPSSISAASAWPEGPGPADRPTT